MPILSLKNVSKAYVQRGQVLDNLSLEVSEGESVAVMGPSGSGKTTLLNIIGLLHRPDKGSVSFRGKDISMFRENESAEYRNTSIGFVFQEHLLLPHLTVEENIYLPLLATRLTSDESAEKEKHIASLMDITGIYSLKHKHPYQISGGEAQRVALVRALANSPSLILADEPTGSLDSKNAEIMGDLLVRMNHDFGITIILATHSAALSQRMTRQLNLLSGKLV
ncbi:MAG TPA: ABC transporter ATP-binding protein [Bacteroidales bacterium]|nr:ABC transporter ATP-binding protein [Bacteroidales bacterium]